MTVNEVLKDSFRLTIIPHTIENTLFKRYKVGTKVNLETDMFARYIYNMFKKDEKGQPILGQPLRTKEEIAADPVQVAPVLAAYASGNRDMLRAIWNVAIYNMNQPSPEDHELYLDAIFKQRNLVDIDYSLMTFNMTDSATLFSPGSGRLSKIECPVVLLHGEKDLVVPLAWARMAMGQIEGSRMITFSDDGHSVLTDDLGLFADTVRKEMS